MAFSRIQIKPGVHACHLFQTLDEQRRVALPFFAEGLHDDEACVLVTADRLVDAWREALGALWPGAGKSAKDGPLRILPGSEWRGPGTFRSVAAVRETWALFERLTGRHAGLRLVFDASWTLDPPLPADQLCHWEATAGLIYEGENIRVICQYGLGLHAPASINAALRTHPVALVSGRAVVNPYCDAALILANEPHLNRSDVSEAELQAMLTRLAGQPEVS